MQYAFIYCIFKRMYTRSNVGLPALTTELSGVLNGLYSTVSSSHETKVLAR